MNQEQNNHDDCIDNNSTSKKMYQHLLIKHFRTEIMKTPYYLLLNDKPFQIILDQTLSSISTKPLNYHHRR
ncbi:unnamed protein product, partial [Rotaria magnacalcarata]